MVLALVRALVIAVLGALAGGCCMVLAFSLHPAVTFDMSRASPREVASGFYPPERAGELTFAWTSRRADVKLAGLNRATEWRCAVRLRGGRGPELPLPRVDVAADGLSVAERTVTNTFEDVPFTVVPRPAPGLSLSITSVPTFVPGPSDTRELGVMVDGLECRPEGRLVLPPRGPLQNAVLASAAFGAALGIVCTTLGGAAAVTLVVSAGQAFLLSIGAAPYGAYARTLLQFAVSIATLMVLTVKVLEPGVGEQGRRAARFIVIFSAAVLYLKILGLLHPSKLLADALFHAHRLEWVLAGRYFFTQPMPSGVSFPYAIGLYVFAAPWASLTSDHVTLLRVVVCVSDALAGAMLYLAIVKIWNDRLAAALAVVLYNVVPLTYGLLSDANLTNLFAQSVALVALMATAVLPLESRKFVGGGVLFALVALAFLSHISTFAILSITLVALVALSLWKGGEFRHRRAVSLLTVTVLAALFSVVTYLRTLRRRVCHRPARADSDSGGECTQRHVSSEPGAFRTRCVFRHASLVDAAHHADCACVGSHFVGGRVADPGPGRCGSVASMADGSSRPPHDRPRRVGPRLSRLSGCRNSLAGRAGVRALRGRVRRACEPRQLPCGRRVGRGRRSLGLAVGDGNARRHGDPAVARGCRRCSALGRLDPLVGCTASISSSRSVVAPAKSRLNHRAIRY